MSSYIIYALNLDEFLYINIQAADIRLFFHNVYVLFSLSKVVLMIVLLLILHFVMETHLVNAVMYTLVTVVLLSVHLIFSPLQPQTLFAVSLLSMLN